MEKFKEEQLERECQKHLIEVAEKYEHLILKEYVPKPRNREPFCKIWIPHLPYWSQCLQPKSTCRIRSPYHSKHCISITHQFCHQYKILAIRILSRAPFTQCKIPTRASDVCIPSYTRNQHQQGRLHQSPDIWMSHLDTSKNPVVK